MKRYQIADPETGQAYFRSEELACPTTGEIRLAKGFAEELLKLRKAFGEAMIVTSCCRSPEHNKKLIREGLPAHPKSLHLTQSPHREIDGCCAIDIAVLNSGYAWRLARIALSLDWSVGLAKTFIHLDLRKRFINRPPAFFAY